MLDLCSGIAGISMAADWAGIETANFVEVDELSESKRGSYGFGSTGIK